MLSLITCLKKTGVIWRLRGILKLVSGTLWTLKKTNKQNIILQHYLTLWPTFLCLVGNPVPKLTTSIDQITSSVWNLHATPWRIFKAFPWKGLWKKQQKKEVTSSSSGGFSQTIPLRLAGRSAEEEVASCSSSLWQQLCLRTDEVSLEVSHFMKMRTSVRRYPLARYPYLTPAPRAATVSRYGGSGLTLLLPHKTTKKKKHSLKSTRKGVKYPTQKNLPVRTGARFIRLL